jgi:ComF family protein
MLPLLKDLVSLFWPPVCPVCGGEMPEGAHTVCTQCRWDAPLTGFWLEMDNPVVRKFWGIIPVINACSFIFFVHGSGFRDLVHDIKYRGRWRQAEEWGRWFGAEMAAGGLYADVDVVIPVPLHLRKRLKRGYNQSEYLADGMAAGLGVEVDSRSVRRTHHNPSQVLKPHRERWENVEGIFAVGRPERLAGKHILLVDDVLTTGATITSCAEAILAAAPDCRISIATLAVSKRDIEVA